MCTNIDIGGIAVAGIRTTVAGALVRSWQIRQTPAVGRIELAGWLFVALETDTNIVMHVTMSACWRVRWVSGEGK